ncbi:AMP-binding protein [Haloechinothrix halophila]|uniref:AMP-binding protein n=1 Tax=Haloechinothrix halophila TaxID=1069073 RepID=UPI00041EE79B|nr:AMP-binding protein [Haloechinothrix halophila]
MPSDCIVFDALVRHPRVKVWQLIGDPEMYPRFFLGITDCQRIGSSEPNVPTRYRFTIGLGGKSIQHTVQTVLNRHSQKLALANDPDSGSWCSVNLVDDGPGRTRVSLSFFKPGLYHDNTRWSKNEVRAWARDGMQRICDFLDRAPTSVIANRGDAATFQLSVASTLRAAGVLTLAQPNKGIAQLRAVGKWGHTLVGGYIGAAARSPQDIAVVDEHGTRTFAEVHSMSTRLAAGLRTHGIDDGSSVAILARNHAVMVETLLACGKLGANVLLLNVGLAGQQLVDAITEHGADTVIADDEFDALLRYLPGDVLRISTSLRVSESGSATEGIDDLLREARDVDLRPPRRPGTLVVMTSGTSGTPKGARRPTPKGLGVVAAMLSRLPLRTGERMFIAAPLFHSWGLAALQISTPLRATVLLQERFDAEACLRAIAEHRVTSLFAIPIMLRRIMNLPADVRERYDTSSLRVVASSGSAMSGALVTEFMDAFGDVLYNFYGSTEVSWGTIADPADLRAAPTTAGTPPLGTRVGILDDDGTPVPYGSVGRIFVGNEMLFDGYTDGGSKDIENKLMDTGDVGYLDANGRLFVSGRQDEMIISGGENVFPRSVEEAIALLPQVEEVAVVGAPDAEYGQRLVAYVVVREGARLDAEMVRRYIRHRLPRFAVPRDVHFVTELPRNPTGKILKRLLVDGTAYPHTPSA